MTRPAIRSVALGWSARLGTPDGMIPVVGGPCDGQRVRFLSGAPVRAVLFRPGESPATGPGHDYRWDGANYVFDLVRDAT